MSPWKKKYYYCNISTPTTCRSHVYVTYLCKHVLEAESSASISLVLCEVIVEVGIHMSVHVHVFPKNIFFELLEEIAEVKIKVSGFTAAATATGVMTIGGTKVVIVTTFLVVTQCFVS